MIGVLETHRAAGLEIEQLRAQLALLVSAQRARRAGVRLVVDTLKSYVGGRFGLKSSQYAAFGFAPKPRKQPTVETMKGGGGETARDAEAAAHDGEAAAAGDQGAGAGGGGGARSGGLRPQASGLRFGYGASESESESDSDSDSELEPEPELVPFPAP